MPIKLFVDRDFQQIYIYTQGHGFLVRPSNGRESTPSRPSTMNLQRGSKSWALMGQRLVQKLGMIKQELRTEPDDPTPQGKGLLIREYEFPPSLTSPAPPPCGRSLLLYILSFGSSSSYTYQSSMPILECTSYRPLLLTLCELLWPQQHYPEVTST